LPRYRGKIESIDAKYELLQRGQYEHLANILRLEGEPQDAAGALRGPHAIQIARSSGADRFAAETFQKAEDNLKQAEAYRARNAGSKQVTMTARQAVQIAEDARAIAVKRQDDELLAPSAKRARIGNHSLRTSGGSAIRSGPGHARGGRCASQSSG